MERAHFPFLIGFLVLLVACQPTVPSGAPFSPLAPPGPNDTLIYVYREDSLRGVEAAEITLDGENLGRLLNGEYLAFLVDPGRHELKARLMWFQIVPRSWNSLDLTTEPGQTVYLRVWAAYQQNSGHPVVGNSPELSTKSTQANVFLEIQNPEKAKTELATMRRSSRQ